MQIFDADRELRRERLNEFGGLLVQIVASKGAPADAQDLFEAAARTGGGGLITKALGSARRGDEWAVSRRVAMQGCALNPTLLKAAVDALTPSDPGWSDYLGVASAFVTTVVERSLLGRLATKRVGFKRSAISPVVAASAEWVSNSAPKPATRSEWTGVKLDAHKVAALLVVDDGVELAARADVAAALAADLSNACTQALDAKLCSSDAASASAPAGLAANAQSVSSTGDDFESISTDLASMVDAMGVSLASAAWVASPKAAATLRLKRIADTSGETVAGLPLLSSEGATGLLLVAGGYIASAFADAVNVRYSCNATVEMDTAPSATPSSAQLTSMFQANLAALRAEFAASWELVGPSDSTGSAAVVELTGAGWVRPTRTSCATC